MTIEGVMGSLVVSVPAIILIGFTVVDVVRRRDLSIGRKIIWLAAVVVLPVFGTFFYLLARPFPDPIMQRVERNDRTAQFVKLLDRRERGSLSGEELEEAARRLFGDKVAS